MTFLCTDRYCLRYMRGGRGEGEPDTGTNHVGFRSVRDPARAGRRPLSLTRYRVGSHDASGS